VRADAAAVSVTTATCECYAATLLMFCSCHVTASSGWAQQAQSLLWHLVCSLALASGGEELKQCCTRFLAASCCSKLRCMAPVCFGLGVAGAIPAVLLCCCALACCGLLASLCAAYIARTLLSAVAKQLMHSISGDDAARACLALTMYACCCSVASCGSTLAHNWGSGVVCLSSARA
jgi:hypothetical protein